MKDEYAIALEKLKQSLDAHDASTFIGRSRTARLQGTVDQLRKKQSSEQERVIQADRQAAWDFQNLMAARIINACRDAKTVETLGEDEGDSSPLIQAFARHRRLASTRSKS